MKMSQGKTPKEECEEEPCYSGSPGPDLIEIVKQEIKEEPEEFSIKQEENVLPVSQSSVCVKREDLSQLQTEAQREKTNLQPKTERENGEKEQCCDANGSRATFSCSEAQMETRETQNSSQTQNRELNTAGQTSIQSPEDNSGSETSESEEGTSQSDGDTSENDDDVPDWVHQCPFCKKRFMRRYHYDNHIRTHTGEKPFTCSICSKSFAADSTLKGHMAVHNEPKNSCPVCKKSFVQKGYLKIHMRIHSGERPYSCSVCAKSFTSPSNFSAHMRAHNEDRRYTCSFCGRAFVRSGTLKQHLLLHTGEKPFSCSVCDEKFIKKRSLLAHMEDKHDDEDK